MKNVTKVLIGIGSVLVLWQIIAMLGIFNPIFFASPIEVGQEATVMLQQPDIYNDIFATFYRVILSVLIAVIIGLPLGIALGYFSRLYQFVGEIVDFLRSIPPIVIYPLLLISLGPGDASRIGTAVFGSIAVLILIISQGLFQQDKTRQVFFKSRGVSTIRLLKEVVWYEALPHTMTALRTATSISLVVIVVTEMLVGGRHGLGARVQQVQINSNIPDLFATIILIGLIGIILNKLLIWFEIKYVFWKTE